LTNIIMWFYGVHNHVIICNHKWHKQYKCSHVCKLKISFWHNVYKSSYYLKTLVTIEFFVKLGQHGTITLNLVQNRVRFKKLCKLTLNEASMATMATNYPDLKQIQLVFSPFHESLHFLLSKILSFNNNVCSMRKLFTNLNWKFFSFWLVTFECLVLNKGV